MSRIILAVLISCLFLFSPGVTIGHGATLENRAYFPPVLMYHDIKVPENGFDVSVEDFRKQLDWLQQAGYTTLSGQELLGYLKQGKAFPEKSILITFDDGYQGIYTYALPELKQRNMKAVFFIIPDDIDTALPGYPYVTEKQVLEIAAEPNFTIGSHTMTHPDLVEIPVKQVQKEISDSKTYLEKLTGKPCNLFAYPCGFYNQAVINSVKKAGYEAAFAVMDRGLKNEKARFSIPRIYMGTVMADNDMKLFKDSVENYKKMPKKAFAERYKFFRK